MAGKDETREGISRRLAALAREAGEAGMSVMVFAAYVTEEDRLNRVKSCVGDTDLIAMSILTDPEAEREFLKLDGSMRRLSAWVSGRS